MLTPDSQVIFQFVYIKCTINPSSKCPIYKTQRACPPLHNNYVFKTACPYLEHSFRNLLWNRSLLFLFVFSGALIKTNYRPSYKLTVRRSISDQAPLGWTLRCKNLIFQSRNGDFNFKCAPVISGKTHLYVGIPESWCLLRKEVRQLLLLQTGLVVRSVQP